METQAILASNDNPTTKCPPSEEAGLAYWKSYLDGCSPCHFPSLGTVSPGESGSVPVSIGNSITRIESFYETKISVSTVFQVAWGLVLRAYTGQDSVCFGDVKTAPGDAGVIGRPIHVGVCRIEFSDTATSSEILQTIQAAGIERRAIHHVRLLDVIQSTGISDAPLFNTCMSFPCKEGQKPIEKVECDFDNQYNIVVRCKVEGSGMGIALDYQTSVLSEKQAIGIAYTFERAVSSLIGNDDAIGQICLLSDVDKSQIYNWNKDPPLRAHCCVDTLIHERCLSQPMAPAVCAWDGEFSYAELDHLSSAAAQHLVVLGVCPEVFVPLLLEKSRWVTIAMLGVIKAGGAFVLLDPSHPVARLQSICQSVSARLIVVSAQHAKLAADLATTVVEIGYGEAEWIVNERPSTPSSVRPENALYAVFTSGSTGAPKGIVSEHASFHAAILPYTQAVGLDHESKVFQFCSHAFDVTIFDTLITLIIGGCVCVPSNTDRWSDVENAIQHYRATHAALTPTVARILDPKDLPTLKTLVLGGEKLATTDMAKWVDHLQVVNLYGASECSIMSIQSITGNASTFRTTDYATGSACWIVDPKNHERLLPIGAIGELVIEGSIVGRGYLGDPEKTATTFIQPPGWLCQLRGRGYRSAVYKSGDLAQYTADGSIRFIGRKDTQVKLRGQRIELGEVEHHIRLLFLSARDVVAEVVTTRDPSRTPMLVAFVGSGNDADPKSRDHEAVPSQILTEPTDWFRSQIPIVKSQLQQSLPSYMVPSVFLPLVTLPLTRTAKTDRRLLRELAAGLSREELESYQFPAGIKRAPLTTIEKLLQQYFARALNVPVEQVGADDHFFHSGGDSLTVMKLVAMARKDKYKITVQDVFDHPRLSALARVVPFTTSDEEEVPPEPFSLVNKQRDIIRAAAQQCHLPVKLIEDVYPCTPLQRGFMSATMQDSRAFIADLALSLPPDIDLQRLKAAWIAVANSNPILRTRMVLSASHGLLQVVVRENIRWTVSENNGARNFVVGVGKPLVQLVLCCHQEGNLGQLQLFLMIHHAVYDGWTLPLVFAEVEAAYCGSSRLVPHPVSPFIRYLQSIPDGEDYWNTLMGNLQTPIFPPLPFKTYQPFPNAIKNTTIITLGPSSRQFTPSTYVRLAWAIVQARQQGTSDVFFGTVVSGRNAPVAGIESMTAPTVATVPCRVTLDLQSPVRGALHKIQDDTITGIPFEQFGLLNIRRLGEHAALACSFQTLLAMQPGVGSSTFSWLEQPESAIDYRADATYAINLICGFEGNELKVTALYDFNVVKEEEMQRMMADFGHVLQALHKSPDCPVQDIRSVRK